MTSFNSVQSLCIKKEQKQPSLAWDNFRMQSYCHQHPHQKMYTGNTAVMLSNEGCPKFPIFLWKHWSLREYVKQVYFTSYFFRGKKYMPSSFDSMIKGSLGQRPHVAFGLSTISLQQRSPTFLGPQTGSSGGEGMVARAQPNPTHGPQLAWPQFPKARGLGTPGLQNKEQPSEISDRGFCQHHMIFSRLHKCFISFANKTMKPAHSNKSC